MDKERPRLTIDGGHGAVVQARIDVVAPDGSGGVEAEEVGA